MNSLDDYINNLSVYFEYLELNDLEIVRYIYMDLGSKLSFDELFIPFGNSKTKQNIYKYKSQNLKSLNECLKNKKVICKSLCYILEYIIRNFNIDIKTVKDEGDYRKCPHVFNVVTIDGNKYIIDLQEDIYNIQSNTFTKNFGIPYYSNQKVIDRQTLNYIDKKLGFNNKYIDEYLVLMHSVVDYIDDIEEKLDFILKNIDVYNLSHMGYIDLVWHHKSILEEFFNYYEFNYETGNGLIKMYDCYKIVNGNKKYYNVISLHIKNNINLYIYDVVRNRYNKIEVNSFKLANKNGLIVYNASIPGLRLNRS